MAKRTDLKKIMIIGSGPIVIGQAAEFDYAGTQACLALKEEGYEVVLVNSNPATIMTDTSIADKVYMEPLTVVRGFVTANAHKNLVGTCNTTPCSIHSICVSFFIVRCDDKYSLWVQYWFCSEIFSHENFLLE